MGGGDPWTWGSSGWNPGNWANWGADASALGSAFNPANVNWGSVLNPSMTPGGAAPITVPNLNMPTDPSLTPGAAGPPSPVTDPSLGPNVADMYQQAIAQAMGLPAGTSAPGAGVGPGGAGYGFDPTLKAAPDYGNALGTGLHALFGSGKSGGMGVGPLDIMGIWNAINRGILQRNFMDPNYLAKNASALFRGVGRGTKALVNRDVMSTAAEGGYASSPGMIRTATAMELAPYEEQRRNADLAAQLQAWQMAQNEDPLGGLSQFGNELQRYLLQNQAQQAQNAQTVAANWG